MPDTGLDAAAENAVPLWMDFGDNLAEATASASCPSHTTRYASDQSNLAGSDVRNIVLVYVLPSDAVDNKIDVPKMCTTSGQITASPLQKFMRNMAYYMRKQYSANASIDIRPRFLNATYISSVPGNNKVLPIVHVERDTSAFTSAVWDAYNPQQRLDHVRDMLQDKGYDDPDSIYIAAVSGKQNEVTGFNRATLGFGYPFEATDSGCGTNAASHWCYAYTLTQGWSSSNSAYVPSRPGCANRGFDTIASHEMTHVLGAVPTSAPNDDGDDHITTLNDLMRPAPGGYLATGATTVDRKYDEDANDYRDDVRHGWHTTDAPPLNQMIVC